MKQGKQSKSVFHSRLTYHSTILLFSLLISVLVAIPGIFKLFSRGFLEFFLILFLQLEVFLLTGMSLFRNRLGTTVKEITLNIVLRFIIFYFICLLSAAIIHIGVKTLMQLGQTESISEVSINFFRYDLKNWAVMTNVGLIFGAFVFFILQWQHSLKRELQLTKENLDFRYETLKNQVNPHFLFNSLNTLQSFIRKNPELAEEYVSRLASIYRYITDKGSSKKVTLREELDFVRDYFYLHKLRDGDKIELRIDSQIDLEKFIIPVSVQMLIENALKHNIATEKQPLGIEISSEEDSIKVKNNLQRTNSIEPTNRTGLTNLNNRYRLSTGKEISVMETSGFFIVKVPLLT